MGHVELGQDDDNGEKGENYAGNEETLDDDYDENVEGDNKEDITKFVTLTPTRTCLFFSCIL
jgi:hypothetical protein